MGLASDVRFKCLMAFLFDVQKSKERIELEKEIKDLHKISLDIAMEMVQDEFEGNLEAALSDDSFVHKMQESVRTKWEVYRNGYRRLEDLEEREGYPAMHTYASELDLIAEQLPRQNRVFCYYPFSSVDFYWARIFDRIVFEDISFDQEKEIPTMWWDPETYGFNRRTEIISTLRTQGVISSSAIMEFVAGNAEIDRYENQFNNQQSTLLVKGGHDVLGYVGTRFKDKRLEYGAIITVTSTNPLRDMEDRFAEDGYRRHVSIEGKGFLAPYSMELKDIHIFLKNSS